MINKFKNQKKIKRPYVIPILLVSALMIYFYLGIFFQPGIDYYGHFLQKQEPTGENQVTIYKGKTSNDKVILKSSVMNQTDRLVEVTIGDEIQEYVIESTMDCTKVRLFDADNTLILESSINIQQETITTPMGTGINYVFYTPIEGELYNKKNPDPILLITASYGLVDISRGNFSKLMFAALIYATLVVDFLFPDFFIRFKSLTYRGEVEKPKYYRKMQVISWIVVPIILIFFLADALS